MSLDETIAALGRRARAATRALATRDTAAKNAGLTAIASELRARGSAILEANAADVARARDKGTKDALVDRLALNPARLEAIAKSVEAIRDLPDPVGVVVEEHVRPDGLRIRRVRVPLGVIAMIYEARPNVTVEAAALTLKAGDAVVLRGGSDAARSNAALAAAVRAGLAKAGLPEDAVSTLDDPSREMMQALLRADGSIDLAIPRGGEALIRFVTEHARVPVVQHYKGVCHLFVDAGADAALAAKLAVNAKLSRPGVCNALECLLVDAASAATLLPPIAEALLAGGCELRGDERTCALVPQAKPAREDDWGREYLDTILAVRTVDGLEGALAHIARFGSGHTEAICTRDEAHAERFRREVDAACVVVNASTRFHDGGELGLGAEIGIATSRLHWRGPMGLESLTTMKWVVDGAGQVRP
jgi:glutamate-5-semialdehyde dehydrogenase